MIRAVMFDMDGVLVDSEPAHRSVTQEVLRERGLPVPDERDWEQVFLGRPDRDGLAEWFRLRQLAADVEAVMAAKLTCLAARFSAIVPEFEDGQWLARQLRRRGVPLALVSGARRVEVALVLRRFDLAGVFAATVSADDVAVGKPDPAPYLRGAAALKVPPAACLVIEDAVPGVRAAEAAGAPVIAVDRLGRPERFAPIQPVQQLDEAVLASIVDRLMPGG